MNKILNYLEFINEAKEVFRDAVVLDLNTYDEIKTFLDNERITNYKINDDLSVSVTNCKSESGLMGVGASDRSYGRLPVNFDVIIGSFWCHHNFLTTLKGSPKRISESFFCWGQYTKELKTLEDGPEIVGGGYICERVGLTSLKGAPKRIGWSFDCSYNELTSLEFCPEYIGESLLCNNNKITSLKYIPKHVGKNIHLEMNPIEDIDDLPTNFDLNKLILSNYQVVWEWLIKIFDEDISLTNTHMDWIIKHKDKVHPLFQREYGYLLEIEQYNL